MGVEMIAAEKRSNDQAFQERVTRLEERIADARSHPDAHSAAMYAGIRTLVAATRDRSGARRLRIVTADPGIVRLLEITGVDTLIHVHPSVDGAL